MKSGDLCTHCGQDVVSTTLGNEPYSCPHLQCPTCDSTYHLSTMITTEEVDTVFDLIESGKQIDDLKKQLAERDAQLKICVEALDWLLKCPKTIDAATEKCSSPWDRVYTISISEGSFNKAKEALEKVGVVE